jgi:mannitol/fructose-specific phosphotransferase system IIA component (Ntr-type)
MQNASLLADYTRPSLLLPRLHGRTVAAVINELCGHLAAEQCVDNAETLVAAVLKREAICSTAIPPDWAMPHARLTEVPSLAFAVGILPQPIKWGGDNQLVSLVFLSVVPEFQAASYLKLISSLARLSRDSRAMEQLQQAGSGAEMHQILSRITL